MKNNNVCEPETIEKELADYKQSTKANATESRNKSIRIKWLYTVSLILLSVIIYLLGIITPTRNVNVISTIILTWNSQCLELPIIIPNAWIKETTN